MRSSTILWAILVILGMYGVLESSAVFFGLFTLGLFLILYDFRIERKKPPTRPSASIASSTHTCPNCGMALDAEVAFCPRCGGKVSK